MKYIITIIAIALALSFNFGAFAQIDPNSGGNPDVTQDKPVLDQKTIRENFYKANVQPLIEKGKIDNLQTEKLRFLIMNVKLERLKEFEKFLRNEDFDFDTFYEKFKSEANQAGFNQNDSNTPAKKIESKEKFSNLLSWEAIGGIIAILGAIAAVIGWYFSRQKRNKLSNYLTEVDSVFSNYKMKSRRCEAELYRLKDMVEDDLKKGSIEEGTYNILSQRIDGYLKDVRLQLVEEKFGGLPTNLMQNLKHMLENSQISEEEFKKFIGVLNDTTKMDSDQQEALKDLVSSWKKQDNN